MENSWQQYSEKFLTITPREQYLIILTGLASIVFLIFSFVIDKNLVVTAKLDKQIKQIARTNSDANATIKLLEQSLLKDPNAAIIKRVAHVEKNMKVVDHELLALTSGLINPVQMRYALVDLLKLGSGVRLTSFEVLKATPLNISQEVTSPADKLSNKQAVKQNSVSDNKPTEIESLILYKHGIKLILKGDYFHLRDYLVQLEQLEWQFFWQQFNYQLIEYPQGELHIEMYSLSTKKEFIGV